VIEKLKTAVWFAGRPTHWLQAAELGLRKLRPDRDGPDHAREARLWAVERAVSVPFALRAIGLDGPVPVLDRAIRAEGEALAAHSAVVMGGPADLDLLYAAVRLSNAYSVIETGVAYGWSSLAILAALEGREGAHLVSVDMPYPKMNNDDFVGIVVPDRFRKNWELVRQPDRNGLKSALSLVGGSIDLCHFDSDKSYYGRQFAYPLLWDALSPGGIFISDDIQDNLAFQEFVEAKGAPFAVTESAGKHVGLVRKP
jgi:predicted O-methyltransferase YrrM